MTSSPPPNLPSRFHGLPNGPPAPCPTKCLSCSMCYPVLLFLWLSLWGLALVAGAESLHRWTHPHHPRLNISGWLTPLLHFNAVDVELGQRLHAVLLRHHTALKNLLWLAETALFLDDAPCRRLSGPPDARAAPLCLSPELLGAETERLPRSAIWTPEFQRGLAAEEARLAALSARIVRYMQRPAPGQPHLPYVIIPLFRAVAEHVCDRYHYGHGTAPNAQVRPCVCVCVCLCVQMTQRRMPPLVR